MVDEYHLKFQVPQAFSGSDSSMVDEYIANASVFKKLVTFRFLYGRWIPVSSSSTNTPKRVQIPLWSMNTDKETFYKVQELSSDSSMVDEYSLTTSSLVADVSVQIPLWSMNTIRRILPMLLWLEFRFLYGRWILVFPLRYPACVISSDSSMVDEYVF